MVTLVRLPRLLRIPVAAVVAASAIAFVYPGGLNAAWADLRDYSKIHSEMESETQRDTSLRGTVDVITNRLMLKEILVRDLIANRSDLSTTAEQFLSLWEGDTGAMHRLRQRYAGSTDLERACRNVIEYTQAYRPNPSVLARLDDQFSARYGQASRIVRPSALEVTSR